MKKILSFVIALSFIPTTFAQEVTELGQVEDFGDLVSKIWGWGFVVILSLSVAMIIVGGFLYMASSGNDERIDQAKQIINGSIISTGIVLFSAVLQKLLSKPAEQLGNEPVSLSQLPDTIKNGVNILLSMIGGFAIIMIIVSGYNYMTSRGDVEKLDHAKRGLMYAFIGLGVAIGAYLIINTFIGVANR